METEGDTHYYHCTLQRTSDYHSLNELLFFSSKSYKSILSNNILLGVCRGLTCTTGDYITEEQRKKRTEYSDILWLSSHGAHIAGKPSHAKMYQVESINPKINRQVESNCVFPCTSLYDVRKVV